MTKSFRFIGILVYFSFLVFSTTYNEDLKFKICSSVCGFSISLHNNMNGDRCILGSLNLWR